jgi:hypothetical protein
VLAFCLGFLSVISLATGPQQNSEPQFRSWDAQYYVVVRGTVTELDSEEENTFAVTVLEAAGSGLGVSADAGNRDVRIRSGAPFEHKFGFFWGGTSRVGGPPSPTPKFRLKIVGTKHCLFREISEAQGAVAIVELGATELNSPCEPTEFVKKSEA